MLMVFCLSKFDYNTNINQLNCSVIYFYFYYFRLKVESELMAMLESKAKTQFNPPENKYSHASEEIYCSVEDLNTRNAKKPSPVATQPVRGALKELSFNKVFGLNYTS